MSSKIFIPAALVLVSSLLCSSVLWANESTALRLFGEGRKASLQGQWEEACSHFEASYLLEPAAGTALNLGRCHEKLGHVVAAWQGYKNAARLLASGDERWEFAQSKATALEQRVPRLTLIAPVGGREADVVIGEATYHSESFGEVLTLEPGAWSIIVRAAGRRDEITEVHLAEGETLEFQIELGQLQKMVTHEAPRDAQYLSLGKAPQVAEGELKNPNDTWAVLAFGVGAAGVLTAVTGAIWIGTELANVHDHCIDKACSPPGLAASRRGRSAVPLTIAGASVAVLGIGLGSFLTWKPEPTTTVGFQLGRGGGVLTLAKEL